MLFTLSVLLAALVALAERGRARRTTAVLHAALASRTAPALVGLCFGAAVWWAWGAVHPPPVFHDELAYLLQAQLFAAGRWAAPSPPVPELFAQAHVLVQPVLASKYPPGHSLLLALGVLAGNPAIVVVALAALRGALTFALARRLTDGTVALATCLLLVYGDSLRFGASYFSETTTGALLLVCWYTLLRWHESGAARWIVLLALSLGWCAITRPFSALLFAIPIGVVVLRDAIRRARWRQLGAAFAVGAAVVLILPLWSARTTGSWREWPASRYTRDYMPFDHPHFGVDSAAPRLPLPSDLATIVPSLRAEEQRHTVAELPRIATERLAAAAQAAWWAPLIEGIAALAGLAVVPAAAYVGVATAAALFVGYLAHPTWAGWTIYYMEAAPVLAFLTVCGLAVMLAFLARRRDEPVSWRAPRATLALTVVMLASALYAYRSVRHTRWVAATDRRYQEQFRAAVARVPGPAILFVRHAAWHSPHHSLVTNTPDWPTTPVWVVADGGPARNAQLLRAAPRRRAFLFDEARARIDPYVAEAAR